MARRTNNRTAAPQPPAIATFNPTRAAATAAAAAPAAQAFREAAARTAAAPAPVNPAEANAAAVAAARARAARGQVSLGNKVGTITGALPMTDTLRADQAAQIAQEAGLTSAAGGAERGERRYLVRYRTKYDFGGQVITIAVYSDGSEEEVERFTDTSAEEDARALFTAAGLDATFTNQLTETIRGVYAANLRPTQAQVLSAIYNSQAYKERFKGNETIRQRIASGQGRPGDRLLTPKEYIDLEESYRTVMQSNGMPQGFYDSPDDYANLIANGVSVAELSERVTTARDALTRADEATKASLRQYYGLETGDLVAYLLDPTRALPVLNGRSAQNGAFGLNNQRELDTMFRVAEVGGAAGRQGLTSELELSREIVDRGKQGQADAAFADAARDDADVRRLGRLYGQSMDYRDLVRETLDLSGGGEAGRRKRKLASRERAAFGGQGALNDASLSRRNDV